MNSLVITLFSAQSITLPIAYNNLLQGAIYHCLRDECPTLHDAGFAVEDRRFRMFTFGPLQGRYSVAGKQITYTGLLRFEVRSPIEDFLASIGQKLSEQGSLRLGSTVLPVVDLACNDRFLFTECMAIRMQSPLTVHTTTPDGHTLYFAPTGPDFHDLLVENTARKLAALEMDASPIVELLPLPGSMPRKRVTTFKGIYITGWTGDFVLQGAPETLCFLYQAGLGSRSSQGFGMFDLLPEHSFTIT